MTFAVIAPQPLSVAVSVTGTLAEVAPVVNEKLTDVWPAGTVTLAGACTTALLLCRFTTIPPLGAGAVSLTVPVRPAPPITAFEGRLTLATHGRGVMDIVALCVTPLNEARTITDSVLATELAVIEKLAEV